MKTKNVETFDITVKIDRIAESGETKAFKETYVVEAFTPTDAEARISEHLMAECQGTLEVVSAKKSAYNEIEVENQKEYWYVVKVELVEIDEKSNKEKRKIATLLLSAANFKAAHDCAVEIMNGTMLDWEIVSVIKSKILDFVGK